MSYFNEILRRILFLPPQASRLAAQIDALHYTVIGMTMLGAMLITALSLFFCIRYRARRERKPNERREPAPTSPLWAELGLIAGLFTLFVAWWAWGFWQYVEIASPPSNSYDVYVSAKQWMWKFAYPDGSHTINTLYVPAEKPVRLILTSRDVIHSFFVPDFRVKQDAVPGRYTSVWFSASAPGNHRIFCAEYCGTWHSRMMGQVIALSSRDFQLWQRDGEREQNYELDPDATPVSAADSSLVERGQRVAAGYGCLRCHSVDGSPHIGPTWLGLYKSLVPIADRAAVEADVNYLTESMMDPHAKIHRGYPNVMPSYLGYLKPGEVGALVEYIKSLRLPSERAPLPTPDGGVYSVPADLPPSAADSNRPAQLGGPR